jgi:hypothetical protein
MDKGLRVQFNSPYRIYTRGKLEDKAYIHILNGATGIFQRRLPSGAALVKWDDLGIDIPVPLQWLMPLSMSD